MKKPAKGKAVPKAKTHRHRKPVTPAIRAARHAAAVKAAKTRAAHKAKTHTRRQLALGEGVACCSAEALAASLRLAGGAVSDDDVLALYWRTASDPDAGASIRATLEAASVWGLAECRPVFMERPLDDLSLPFGQLLRRVEGVDLGEVDHLVGDGRLHGLILGVDLPGPHAVLAEPGRWWSWGEPYDPASWPDAVIEEAWLVDWEMPT